MHYLIDWCRAHQGKLISNGKTVFESKGTETGAFLLEAYQALGINYPKFYKMDNLCKLGLLGAEILLGNSALRNQFAPAETGVVLASRHSSLDTDMRYHETMQTFPSPSLFVYTLANIMAGEICIRHQLKGENTVFIFDKYEIPFLSNYINSLLDEGAAKLIIGGWVDVMDSHYDAFLYLATHLKTDSPIVHDQKNLALIYG